MKVTVLRESGYDEALLGLGLSYGLTSKLMFEEFIDEKGANIYDKLVERAAKLCSQDGGHNGFMQFIDVTLDIKAPQYFWNQWGTYDIGEVDFIEKDKIECSRLSESTMHTLGEHILAEDDFEFPIVPTAINMLIMQGASTEHIKNELPSGFLVRRIIKINYKTLRTIIKQRSTHKLQAWHNFIDAVKSQIEHPELLP
jgi:hypothetical protein